MWDNKQCFEQNPYHLVKCNAYGCECGKHFCLTFHWGKHLDDIRAQEQTKEKESKMKVWTMVNRNGDVVGVYLDYQLARAAHRETDSLEEWQPELTENAYEQIRKALESKP